MTVGLKMRVDRVSLGLAITDSNPISQLLYEVYLVCREEENHKDIIAIYGNYSTWHVFWQDYLLVTKRIKGYSVLINPEPLTLYSCIYNVLYVISEGGRMKNRKERTCFTQYTHRINLWYQSHYMPSKPIPSIKKQLITQLVSSGIGVT